MNEEIEKNKEEVVNIVNNILDKGANYVIKSMPINAHIREVLIDVKKVIKEKEFSQILKVALSSSLKEGMDFLGISESNLKEIGQVVDTAFKGGLTKAINIGIDIVGNAKKYGNIFYNYIGELFDKLKSFVQSLEFKKKIYACIEKCLDKVDTFKELCNDWYDAYDSFNLKDIGEIAGKLNKLKNKVSFHTDCVNENSIIQNITELVSRRKQKLTKTQLDICTNLEEI